MIPQSKTREFYDYVDAMENGEDYEIDFSSYIINNPSDYCFENPITINALKALYNQMMKIDK